MSYFYFKRLTFLIEIAIFSENKTSGWVSRRFERCWILISFLKIWFPRTLTNLGSKLWHKNEQVWKYFLIVSLRNQALLFSHLPFFYPLQYTACLFESHIDWWVGIKLYVMHCAVWDQSLFGVCIDVRTHVNAY